MVALLALVALPLVGAPASPSVQAPSIGLPSPAANPAALGPTRTGGLVATIVSAPAALDLGGRTVLRGLVLGGIEPFSPYWGLALGQVSPGWTMNWTAPAQATVVQALFSVRDSSGASSQAMTRIAVVPPPFLEVGGANVVGDVGAPMRFPVNITGGVGPFTLRWGIVGGASNGSTSPPQDGPFTAAVVPETVGTVWVLASITDADNRSFSAVAPVGRATSAPAIVSSGVPFAEVGYATAIPVNVVGGTPPFSWAVPAAAGVSAFSSSGGVLATDGPLAIAATFDRPGSVVVPFEVVDGAGVSAAANVSVNVSAGLNLSVGFSPGAPAAGSPLGVRATISGGLPPYAYRLVLSDDESTSGNTSLPGALQWSATPVATGYLTLRGSVTDSTGRTSNVSVTVYIAAPGDRGTVAPPSLDAGALGAAAAVGGAAAALVLPYAFRRWRARPRSTPPVPELGGPARALVRELLAESPDGIDRTTLEMLAEERQVGPSELDAALSAWQRAGRVRLEEEDGRQLVHWVARKDGAEPSGGDP